MTISESNFKKYISNHQEFQQYFNKRRSTPKQPALLRFKIEPGEQLQIDWKEDIRFTTFHALDTIFEKLGGVPKTVISENMKTIKEN